MRKLQFIANCPHHYEGHELNECRITQEYVAALLFKQLGEYGFDAHKGYGTAVHLKALQTLGATPFHRKTFAPVTQAILAFQKS